MSKRILLIDSDESFAQGLKNAIEARGFAATTATDSEQGMGLAKSEPPDLIVVCVEAQPTNGYMLCTRLKKDEQLKQIPVILTSSQATADSFEKHKKLKTRAEEYLIKPFAPSTLLEKAAALMGVELLGGDGDEMVTSIEDEPLGLGDLVEGEDEPISLSEQDAQEARSGTDEALVVEEVEEVSIDESNTASDAEDLEMFDQAFDNLSPPSAAQASNEEEKAFGNLRLAPAPADEVQVADDEPAMPTELSAPDDDAVLRGLENDDSPALIEHGNGEGGLEARVAELEQQLAERDAELRQARKGSPPGGDVLKAREAKTKADKEVLRLKEELNAKEKELLEVQEQHGALEAETQQLRDDAAKREAATRTLQQRADALAAAAKKFERELGQAREELKTGGSKGRIEELKRQHEEELENARAEAGKVQLDLDQLKKQVEDAQAAAQQNEDRAVKAYQQLKEGEKLREKARQALQIALRLLDENASADEVERALKAG